MAFLDIPIVQQAAPALEKAINMALSLDPGAQKYLKPLEGCVLQIYFTAAKRSIFFTAQDSKVALLNNHDSPDVTLSGKMIAFVKLAYTDDKQQLFRSKEIELAGDAVRAQQIQRFMANIKLDWEALLAEVVGDVPAHALSTSIRQGIGWGKSLSSNFLTDLEEFIKYELRLLPNKAQGLKQFDAIDQLRAASDRLEARIKRLVSSADKQHTKTPEHANSEES